MAAADMLGQSVTEGAPPDESLAEGRLSLPGGLLDEAGRCHKIVFVRPLTGLDEELLADRRYQNGPQQVSDFLAQVVTRIEGMETPFTSKMAAQMLIGDRDYLLLRLRQINLSGVVEEVVRCPRPACGKKADIEFSIDELRVRRVDEVKPSYEFTYDEPAFADDPESRRGAFRLPAGHDQQAIDALGAVNAATANTRLFSRILLRLGRRAPVSEAEVRCLSLRVRSELRALVAAHSPGPDLAVEVQCPSCGADMTYPFDLYGFFLPNR